MPSSNVSTLPDRDNITHFYVGHDRREADGTIVIGCKLSRSFATESEANDAADIIASEHPDACIVRSRVNLRVLENPQNVAIIEQLRAEMCGEGATQ